MCQSFRNFDMYQMQLQYYFCLDEICQLPHIRRVL